MVATTLFSRITWGLLLLLALSFLPFARPTAAQEEIESLMRFEHLTVADGLAGNVVHTIMQDSRGFLWFGTDNGLSRFDGYTFKTYINESDNPQSLVNNMVLNIREDADGSLWLMTGDGISIYDPTTDTFTTPNLDIRRIRGQRGARFFTSFVDSRGDYWFGATAEAGLIRYRPETDDLLQIPILGPAQSAQGDVPFPGSNVRQIVETEDGSLWMATGAQLVKYNPTSDQYQDYALPIDETRHFSLVLADDGQLWAGGEHGLYHFDTHSKTFHQFDQFTNTTVFFVTADQTIWFSSPSLGLVAFDTRSKMIVQQFSHRIEWGGSIADNAISSATIDQYGVLWVGTTSGVSRLVPQHAQFTWYGYTPTDNSTLAHPHVTAIDVASDKQWWIASAETLAQLDFAATTTTRMDGLDTFNGNFETVFQESNGDLWLGLSEQLIQFNPQTQQATPLEFPPKSGPPTPIADLPAQVVGVHEADDGTLWAGVLRRGLLQIDPTRTTSAWVPTVRLSPDQRQGVGDPIKATANGSGNTLWIAYEPPIVTHFSMTDGSTYHYPLDFGTQLSGNFETADLYEDRSGIVWLATNHGLLRLDPLTESVERIEALSAEPLTSIVGDRGGSLWLGGVHGLFRYRLDDGRVTQFGVGDGLPSVNFARRAADITPDGQLVFGTDNGLVAFYPDDIRLKPPPAAPILTDIQLFNQSISIDGTLLSSTVWSTDQITLAHDQNTLSFEFAASGYSDLENLRYRYRLEGLEDTWTDVDGSRRYVTFGQLPPGAYTLELQTGTRNGEWNEDSTTLGVTVIPAWWQRTAVQTSAVALLVGIIALSLWQRSVRLKQRNAALSDLVTERTRDLSDSEARFRNLAGASFEAILVHADGVIIDANAVAAELLGMEQQQLIDNAIAELALDAELTEQLQNSGDAVWEVETTLPDGRTLVLEGRGDNMPYREHMAQVTALRDITARREREAERERMAMLEERERIGRDLHDDLGQMMGYLSIQAHTAQQQLDAAQPDRANATLQQLADVSREAHHNIRRYILGIRSDESADDTLNVQAALELLASRMRERHALDVTLMLPHDAATLALADEVEAQLLRIVQEALTNIVKHAETARAHVVMTIEESNVRLLIVDSGRGFNNDRQKDGHFGLTIMRERAESVHGSLSITSADGQGTRVEALLPHLNTAGSAETLRNIRVLVVDDHPLYLDGLTALLATRGLKVVGTARDGVEALRLATERQPNLILMDIDMPKRDGLEATQLIHQALPDIKIVMLTVAADEERLLAALRNGASGYLLKSVEGERFFAALADVMQGETVLSPSMASRVLADIAQEDARSAEPKPTVDLTRRQQDVLRLLASGLTNKEIGAELFITVHTVKYHIHKILELLQLESRHQLTRYAKDTGIV